MIVKKWKGSKPETCDLCHKPLQIQFVEGKSCYGPWGIFCAVCHSRFGVGLGTGKGQRYDLASLEKVAG